MNKGKRRNRILFKIFIVVIFISIVFAFLPLEWINKVGSYLTGKAGASSSQLSDITSCSDSDNGPSFYYSGAVTVLSKSKGESYFYDQCSREGILSEYHCEKSSKGDYPKVTRYSCPYGCVERACIQNTSEEKCYMKFLIRESKNSTGGIQFELLESSYLYGKYSSLSTAKYAKGYQYLARVLSSPRERGSSEKILSSYGFDSKRFVYAEQFDENGISGGLTEFPEDIFYLILPFDSNARNVKIFSTFSTDSLRKPLLSFSVNMPQVHCNLPDKKAENEFVNPENESCQEGLTPVIADAENQTFVCANCGDGVCSKAETRAGLMVCPQDCGGYAPIVIDRKTIFDGICISDCEGHWGKFTSCKLPNADPLSCVNCQEVCTKYEKGYILSNRV